MKYELTGAYGPIFICSITLHCITLNLEWKTPKHFSHFTDALKLTVRISYWKQKLLWAGCTFCHPTCPAHLAFWGEIISKIGQYWKKVYGQEYLPFW